MTKQIVLTLLGCWLALMAGIITAASWGTSTTTQTIPVERAKVEVNAPTPEPRSESDVVFAGERLMVLPDEVQLKSERLRYRVKARYPQIVGSDDIKKLNARIKRRVDAKYQWLLNPSKAELRRYKGTFPDVFNFVELNYEIVFHSQYYLSIYFNSFSYGIGAAHSVQESFVINYDLKDHKELKLDNFFNPNKRTLEFIARYCTTSLSLQEPLTPKIETFASWNLVHEGIRFNFDACTIKGCADGAQTVVIPLTSL